MPVIDGEFQPTTAAVRAIYANTVTHPDAGPAFDRWLAGVRADQAEKTLLEGIAARPPMEARPEGYVKL